MQETFWIFALLLLYLINHKLAAILSILDTAL